MNAVLRVRLVSLFLLCLAMPCLAATVRGKVTLLVEDPATKEWAPSPSHEGAVVYLTGLEEPPPAKSRKIYLDQQGKAFVPRVLAINAGETVIFRNRDEVHHNVWSLSSPHPFDLGSYKAPEEKTVRFKNPGLIRIFCNVHPQMIGSVLVLKNNKHVATNASGDYELKNLPAGKFHLRVWSEGSEPTVHALNMPAKGEVTQDFKIKITPVSVEHLNKFGKPYSKY